MPGDRGTAQDRRDRPIGRVRSGGRPGRWPGRLLQRLSERLVHAVIMHSRRAAAPIAARAALAGAAALLWGCSGPQSMLDPAGPSARAIATVWWWMAAVAAIVLVGIVAVWLVAMSRDGTRRTADPRRAARRWIVGGGIVLPGTAVVALLAFGSPAARHHLGIGTRDGPAPLRIDAIGQQWWWELHYVDSGVRLRNELRLPVGRPVEIRTRSRDVIHSFWVPRLGGKIDALPGRTLTMRLEADTPGLHRGQCAEFCGLGHAGMTMQVQAMAPDAFDRWLAAERAAGGGEAGRGEAGGSEAR